MPHCTPGNRFVTAAASRCAVLCRYTVSASGLVSVTIRTEASCVKGIGQIDERAIDDPGQRRLRQPRRNVFGDVAHGRARGHERGWIHQEA